MGWSSKAASPRPGTGATSRSRVAESLALNPQRSSIRCQAVDLEADLFGRQRGHVDESYRGGSKSVPYAGQIGSNRVVQGAGRVAAGHGQELVRCLPCWLRSGRRPRPVQNADFAQPSGSLSPRLSLIWAGFAFFADVVIDASGGINALEQALDFWPVALAYDNGNAPNLPGLSSRSPGKIHSERCVSASQRLQAPGRVSRAARRPGRARFPAAPGLRGPRLVSCR